MGDKALAGLVQRKTTKGKFWFVRLYLPKTADGKRHDKIIPTNISTRGGKTAAKVILAQEIEKYQKELANSAKGHEEIIDEDITFIDYLNLYLQSKKEDLTEVCYYNYALYIRKMENYLASAGKKDMLLTAVRVKHLSDFYNDLRAKGVSYSSIRRYACIFRPALEKAYVVDEIIPNNPHTKLESNTQNPIKRDKQEEKITECFHKEEIAAFWEFAIQHRFINIYKLTFHLGLRRSEIMGLRWSNVDFEKKTVLISGNVQKPKKEIIISKDNKNANSKSAYAMTKEVEELLLAIKKEIQKNKSLLGNAYSNSHSDFVCVDESGKLYSPDVISDGFEKLVKDFGTSKHITFKGLRHSAGTILYMATKDIVATQHFLRHADVKTTMIYLHVGDDSKEHSLNALSAAVRLVPITS